MQFPYEAIELTYDWVAIIQNCCQLIKDLCIYTDSRRDMSIAYDNGRVYIKNTIIVAALIKYSKMFIKHTTLSSYALWAIRYVLMFVYICMYYIYIYIYMY